MPRSAASDRKEIIERLTAVEQKLQQLPSPEQWQAFATKADLAACATKQDLEAFPTRKDAEAYATKQDLEAFPTKKDAEAYATKQDLEAFVTRRDLEEILKPYPTRAEVEAMNARYHAETRRHFEVIVEAHRAEFRAVAEGHLRLDVSDDELRAEIARIAGRVERQDLRLLRVEDRLGLEPPRR